MKKIFVTGISIVLLVVSIISCNDENQVDNENLSNKIDAINQKYKIEESNAKINKKKAGFMAAADCVGVLQVLPADPMVFYGEVL